MTGRPQVFMLSIFSALALCATLMSGCNGGRSDGSEGYIVYDLSYPAFAEDNIFTTMFPSESRFSFKDSHTRTELKTSMAVFSTILLADVSNKKVVHLVRIGRDYSGLEMDSAQVMAEYGKMPDEMSISLTDKKKVIAGYNCSNAIITFKGDSARSFDLYYTEEIKVPEPNWCTPYHKVKGVLMEARVNKFGIEMQMKAREVHLEKVEDSEFEYDPGYKPITVQEMAEIFQSF